MLRVFFALTLLAALSWLGLFNRQQEITWSKDELARIQSLVLPAPAVLAKSVVHTGNQYWDNPLAITLGKQLFFDKALSGNGQVACATCHLPQAGFADPQPFSRGIGVTKRHSPALLGVASSAWFFWDGRADSLWAQALGPLEDPAEQGANRLQLAKLIQSKYALQYQNIFGPLADFSALPNNATPATNNVKWQQTWQSLPLADQTNINRVFANIGKSIAAFESKLLPSTTKFDRFATELLATGESDLLSRQEKQGLKTFINDQTGQCMRCHNGAYFTNNDFQVTGIKDTFTPLGTGRAEGIQKALNSEFSCAGVYADIDDKNSQCQELKFAKRIGSELEFAFKVPSLRNVAQTAPYMHNASLETLEEVLHFYTRAVSQYTNEESNKTDQQKIHLDIEPLALASNQLLQLAAFLRTLNSETKAALKPEL
ncbi:MAG: cytochrome c peroxidase [Oceanospirillaceae bacterium]